MYWSNNVLVDEKKDLVSFQAKGLSRIMCRGLSDLQITGGKGSVDSFVISGLRKDCGNLLVLTVENFNDRGRFLGNNSFILEIECYVSERGEKAIVKPWKPTTVDRIATVDNHGNIEMRNGSMVFSTDSKRQDGSRYINNPNICLNYLAGRITMHEVMDAAEETQKQIDLQQRCDELEKVNKSLSEEVASLQNISDDYRAQLSQAIKSYESQIKGHLTGHNLIVNSLFREVSDWKKAATQLRAAVNSPRFKITDRKSVEMHGAPMIELRSTRIKEALSLFPDFANSHFRPDAE